MKIKKLLLLLIFPLCTYGQEDHKMTAGEKTLMPGYLLNYPASSGIQQPPASPVRASAEWEEIQGLMIAWITYPAILQEIVRAAQMQTTVYIVCTDSTNVKNTLSAAGIPDTNLE